MDVVRFSAHRTGRILSVLGLLVATLIPALSPALAAADTVTDRSVALSSTSKDASGVKYTVGFTTATGTTGAFVVDFCDSAAVGTTCNVPVGVDTTSVAATAGATASAIDSNKAVKVVLSATKSAGQTVSIELTGIHNPTSADTMYARIITYADDTTNYHYTAPDNVGSYVDSGSVALAYDDTFKVSGTVPETLSFCASGATITDCATAGATPPDLSLGTNGILTTTPSTGTVYTQISTNAAKGAIVNLKSDASGCGGLVREGSDTNAHGCGIVPITTAGSVSTISGAQFGMKLGNLGGASSTSTALESSSYDTSNYYMHYVAGDTSGITGPYGDPIYNTGGAPVSEGTADLTFGAAISDITPAGIYKANLGLIATGTF